MIERCKGSCPMQYLGEWMSHEDDTQFFTVYVCKKCGVLYKNSVNPRRRILVNLDNTIEELK